MDAFYASVEANEDPSLAGRPVVVGGTGPRGVVASASYEARAHGVRSAMPSGQARRLCPHAVFLPPRFELYRAASARLHAVFEEVTPLVEGIALDEAFLDVTSAGALFGPPEQIAGRLRRRVREELSLWCSVGVGPNKLVAKLASEAAKPRASKGGALPGPGIVVVTEAQALGFLWPLPVQSIWGIGPASRERLAKLGVATVGDLAALPEQSLVGVLGKAAGKMAHDLAWGRDDRPVVPDRAPKSIGHEETYPTDLTDRRELERRLVAMADQVAGRVRAEGMVARTVTLKLRYGDFRTITRSHTFPSPRQSGPSLVGAAKDLFSSVPLGDGVRLLGVSASGLLAKDRAPGEQLQLELGEPMGVAASGPSGSGEEDRWDDAMGAVDKVRARFGSSAVSPAGALAPPPADRREGTSRGVGAMAGKSTSLVGGNEG